MFFFDCYFDLVVQVFVFGVSVYQVVRGEVFVCQYFVEFVMNFVNGVFDFVNGFFYDQFWIGVFDCIDD